MTKEQILDYFKIRGKDQGQNLHPLIHDPILRNLIVAWTMLQVEFGDPDVSSLQAQKVAEDLAEIPPTQEEENRWWRVLWSEADYDKEDLANSLRLDPIKITRMVDRAVAFRLIFPDGTVSELAIKYIKGEVAKSLQKKPGPKPKKEEEP